MASISLEFSRLHDRYFSTAPDDTSALAPLAIELQHFKERVKVASLSGSLAPLEATACASIASNIVNLSSCVIKSNTAIEGLCAEFLQKLSIISPNFNQGSNIPGPSSSTDFCPKPPSLIQHRLKKWCRSNLSYLFPTNTQVLELSTFSDMSESQVSSWFRNARTRSGWSKLYADKVHVNRDPSRLEIVFQDYHSYMLSHCQSDIREHISHNEHFRLVDKVWHWFQTDKKGNKLENTGAVRPWVKTVLFEALEKSKESCSRDFKRSFSGFGEPPQMLDQPSLPKLNPPSDIEETASESSSTKNYRCSTLSNSSCESVSESSSDQPMSSSSPSHHASTPSFTSLDFLPSFNSSSFLPSSPSLVSSDLSTPEYQDYSSPPDLTSPYQLSPPSLFTSQTPNPVEIINGLDALFQLDHSSDGPHQLSPSLHSKFLEASTLPSDFFLDSLCDFALPSSRSTNSQDTAEFEPGQFDDASED